MKQSICIFALLICLTNAARDVCWRDYVEGDIPSDAMSAYGGLYVGQIPIGGMIPATIYTGDAAGISESNGRTVNSTEGVKIMCADDVNDYKWIPVTPGNPPSVKKLVLGGVEGDKDIYIGRVFHENQWKIGKYLDSSKNLRIWTSGGAAAVVKEFQVLQHAK